MKGTNMVELFALTSGALAAGIGVYKYLTTETGTSAPVAVAVSGSAPQHSLSPPNPVANRTAPVTRPTTRMKATAPIQRTQEREAALQRAIYSSSIALGLASTALVFFPTLQYASVPALIYMGAPSARAALDRLQETGRPSRALAETAVLAVCLGGGWYWGGSLGFWLYYLNCMQRHQRNLACRLRPIQLAIPEFARLQHGETETVVPIAILRHGDAVRVGTSEIVPTDGVILEGAAWIQPHGTTDWAAYRTISAGDRVMASDVVIAGSISLSVTSPTSESSSSESSSVQSSSTEKVA